MTNGTIETLDMHELLALLDEVREKVVDLDGVRVNIEVRSRQVNAEKADINRKLLYLAHLFDVGKVEVMNHYHRFKGENPPYISAD
jgi:hypothetical protein